MHQLAATRRGAPALEARDVSVRRCGRSLVQRVSLTVDHGELLVLLGAPGSGADTLVALLGGSVPPDAGRVLLDGRTALTPAGGGAGAPPRLRTTSGARGARALLDGVEADEGASIVLLERPTAGLDERGADRMLGRCRATADAGNAVVVSVESATLAARHATTVALFVAGRLLSWGAPAVALVPALQLLGDGRHGVT